MNHQTPDEATCAICGRHFDPSETRGWCPNPSCGQWQHPAFPVGDEPSGSGEPTGAGHTARAPMRSCPNCGNDIRADASFCKHCASQLEGTDIDGGSGGDGAISECPDCGADLTGIPPDRLSKCPICLFNIAPVVDEGGADTTPPAGTGSETDDPATTELTECPNCGEDLTPIPEELRTVCPGCRIDLDEEPPPTPISSSTDETTDSGDQTTLDDLEFIPDGYVRRLSDVGIATVADLVASDPDAISSKTGIASRRIQGWIDEAPADVPPRDPTPTPSEPTPTPRDEVDDQATKIQRSPDELVLEVMGREILVTDGEAVGGQVRNAMVEAGAAEEDAVYVHRKHIRVDYDDQGFRLTRLGENSLTVNGIPIEKGAKSRIEDGDRISFSDVVEATVSVR